MQNISRRSVRAVVDIADKDRNSSTPPRSKTNTGNSFYAVRSVYVFLKKQSGKHAGHLKLKHYRGTLSPESRGLCMWNTRPTVLGLLIYKGTPIRRAFPLFFSAVAVELNFCQQQNINKTKSVQHRSSCVSRECSDKKLLSSTKNRIFYKLKKSSQFYDE